MTKKSEEGTGSEAKERIAKTKKTKSLKPPTENEKSIYRKKVL